MEADPRTSLWECRCRGVPLLPSHRGVVSGSELTDFRSARASANSTLRGPPLEVGVACVVVGGVCVLPVVSC